MIQLFPIISFISLDKNINLDNNEINPWTTKGSPSVVSFLSTIVLGLDLVFHTPSGSQQRLGLALDSVLMPSPWT